MKKRIGTRRIITAEEIFKKVKHFAREPYPKGVTAALLARTVDRHGCTAMHYAAESGHYPEGTKFEDLILAEKHMKARDKKKARLFQENLTYEYGSPFYNSTPLEIAIWKGNFPEDSNQEKLTQAKTVYGTGFDMVVRCLKLESNESGDEYENHLFCARDTLCQFPELVALLDPFKREWDAHILSVSWTPLVMRYDVFVALMAKIDWFFLFILQTQPRYALRSVGLMVELKKETEWIRLLKLFLSGRAPIVRGWDKQTIWIHQMFVVEKYVGWVLRYPEIASVLRSKTRFHAEIIKLIVSITDLTTEQRTILSRNNAIFGAML